MRWDKARLTTDHVFADVRTALFAATMVVFACIFLFIVVSTVIIAKEARHTWQAKHGFWSNGQWFKNKP